MSNVKLCPNCNADTLQVSRMVVGDAKNYIYCKCCFWSEPEDKQIDVELINVVKELDYAFNLYVNSTNVGYDISSNDINALIKDIYRVIIDRVILDRG